MLHEEGSSYATWVTFHKQDVYSGGPGIKFFWLRHCLTMKHGKMFLGHDAVIVLGQSVYYL